jgi:hypothetical protein
VAVDVDAFGHRTYLERGCSLVHHLKQLLVTDEPVAVRDDAEDAASIRSADGEAVGNPLVCSHIAEAIERLDVDREVCGIAADYGLVDVGGEIDWGTGHENLLGMEL